MVIVIVGRGGGLTEFFGDSESGTAAQLRPGSDHVPDHAADHVSDDPRSPLTSWKKRIMVTMVCCVSTRFVPRVRVRTRARA